MVVLSQVDKKVAGSGTYMGSAVLKAFKKTKKIRNFWIIEA